MRLAKKTEQVVQLRAAESLSEEENRVLERELESLKEKLGEIQALEQQSVSCSRI